MIIIQSLFGHEVLYVSAAATMKEAIEEAVAAGKVLERMSLPDEDLAGVDLRGARLQRADLTGSRFTGADFRGADVTEVCFRGADLTGADFTGATFADTNFSGATLVGAVFGDVDVPVVEDIDRKILERVERDGRLLNMEDWHIGVYEYEYDFGRDGSDGGDAADVNKVGYRVCYTSHCRAGWAVHLAGARGYALEAKWGPCVAGALIYAASRPDKAVPNFYEGKDQALADLREGARSGGV